MRHKKNITNNYLVMNFYITEKEEKSNKIKDTVRTASITLLVQKAWNKALPYVQQFLLSVLSCFTPGGYVVPQVEQHQEQTVTVNAPEVVSIESTDGSVTFLQYAGN